MSPDINRQSIGRSAKDGMLPQLFAAGAGDVFLPGKPANRYLQAGRLCYSRLQWRYSPGNVAPEQVQLSCGFGRVAARQR